MSELCPFLRLLLYYVYQRMFKTPLRKGWKFKLRVQDLKTCLTSAYASGANNRIVRGIALQESQKVTRKKLFW